MGDLEDLTGVRDEVRAWLAEHASAASEGVSWMEVVFDAGWATPSWPEQWGGRGLPVEATHVVREEFARARVPGAGHDLSNIPANTLLQWGSDELKATYLRPFVTGELRSCLLYSEPSAGSDLAGVRTRAERGLDGWIVNGQKVWTTQGREADYGLLVARTNWDVPKHQGISYLLCPMHQPGVEVRPIIQITGGSSFNEVFLTDALIPFENMIGEENNGWRVLATALAVERVMLGGVIEGGQAGGTTADLVALAIAHGRENDELVRQSIARLHAWGLMNRWNTMRAKAAKGAGGPSVASINKLSRVRIQKTRAELVLSLLGEEGMLDDPGHESGDAVYGYLGSMSASFVGGTDQIQRNIIGERVLGLPREPEVDRDVPFREVRTTPRGGRSTTVDGRS
jgi:alkylation response protein AidB-like acyl-CoA dehydrogenase